MVLPCTLVQAQLSRVPHEDPAAAESLLDAYSFLTQYVDVLSLAASRQYDNASRLAEQLSSITVPADLAYIINRYNNITQQLINVLRELETTLDNASALLNQYRLDDAWANLNRAGVLVAEAQIILSDLQDATATLSQSIGVFAAPVASKVRQAYDELSAIIQRLNELIEEYHRLLQEIKQQAENITKQNLTATTITLSLNTTSCFVGQAVTASGVLRANGTGMQSRTVKLLLDGGNVATVITNANGEYSATLQIPYRYVHTMSVQALYSPSGNDTGVYLGSASPKITLNVNFYETQLTVLAPTVGYPGLQLAVSGNISSLGTLSGRQVQMHLDGVTLATTQTNNDGTFSFKVTLSASTKTGAHTLALSVLSVGVYAGANVQKAMNVTLKASTVQVEVPTFVMAPSDVFVSGQVFSSSIPLVNANVTIQFTGSTTSVLTSSDGSYNATISIPLNAGFVGSQVLTVSVDPAEPWQANRQTSVDVFVLSYISVVIALVAGIAVFGVVYVKFARGKHEKIAVKETLKAPSVLSEKTAVIQDRAPELKVEYKFEGTKGKVLQAYVNAVKLVQQVTGRTLEINMTLREFLKETEPRLGEAAGVFVELTGLAERALYSAVTPTIEEAKRAEALANKIGGYRSENQ